MKENAELGRAAFLLPLAALLGVLLLLSMASCTDREYRIRGEGPTVTNTRMPGMFNGISLALAADVEVYRDSAYRVELVGQQNVLNVIETRSSNGTLFIGLEYRYRIYRHDPLLIRVYTPDISLLDISGSGDITCMNDFNTAQLSTNVSGSGDIHCRGGVSGSFTATVSGSGSIHHQGSGNCGSARYTVSGSGRINAEWLGVSNARASISGSGDIRLHALDDLRADISGSGNIYYRGNPVVVKSISGSGKVIKIN